MWISPRFSHRHVDGGPRRDRLTAAEAHDRRVEEHGWTTLQHLRALWCHLALHSSSTSLWTSPSSAPSPAPGCDPDAG